MDQNQINSQGQNPNQVPDIKILLSREQVYTALEALGKLPLERSYPAFEAVRIQLAKYEESLRPVANTKTE